MKIAGRWAGLCGAAVFWLAFSAAAMAAPLQAVGGFGKQVHQHTELGCDSRGEYEQVHIMWAGLTVNEEIRRDYPLLAQKLETLNKQEWHRSQLVQAEMKAEAVEFRQNAPQYYHPLGFDYDVQVRRADSLVCSFLQKEYTNGSGAHGMYSWWGVNYNSLTGTAISLSSLVKDDKALAKALGERLRQNYPESSLADIEGVIEKAAAEDKLNWTLDPRGVTFYFNPYEIASYAEGLLMATILFQEQPELFQGWYTQTAPAYAQPFDAYYPLTTTLRDDGHRDVITVQEENGQVRVQVNTTVKELAAQLTDLQPVLVHMADGRNYLYIDGQCQDTSRQTLVVQIGRHSASYVTTLPFSGRHTEAVAPAVQEYWHFLTNPNGFYFDRSGSYTTTTKTDICAVGERGELTFG